METLNRAIEDVSDYRDMMHKITKQLDDQRSEAVGMIGSQETRAQRRARERTELKDAIRAVKMR